MTPPHIRKGKGNREKRLKISVRGKATILSLLMFLDVFLVGYVKISHDEKIRNNKIEELQILRTDLVKVRGRFSSIYSELKEEKKKLAQLIKKAEKKANDSLKEKICRTANIYNNEAENLYLEAQNEYVQIKEMLPSYKIGLISFELKQEEVNTLEEDLDLELTPKEGESIDSTNLKDELQDIDNLSNLIKKSKEHANALVDEWYPDMSRIVNAESQQSYDQLLVMDVIVNRIKSKNFPNTLHGVIFAKGQYSPTWNGAFYKKVNQKTKENVLNYLRGKTKDTGMPDDVVYQAQFKQADRNGKIRVWKENNNHYYCYQ